jgi:hypothetical protein
MSNIVQIAIDATLLISTVFGSPRPPPHAGQTTLLIPLQAALNKLRSLKTWLVYLHCLQNRILTLLAHAAAALLCQSPLLAKAFLLLGAQTPC